MQADNKNMERMVEVVPDSDWKSLQNFLSHSPWGERGLLDQLAVMPIISLVAMRTVVSLLTRLLLPKRATSRWESLANGTVG
jgi:hypothetical protein